jgi:DNA-binding MarR family transcriptional regulator
MTRRQPPVALDLTGTADCAAFALRKATRAVTQLYDDLLRETGLRSTQLAVLIAVAKRAPISVGDLAALTVLDPSTMTRSLRVLADADLIDIAPRGVGRQKQISLTARGRRMLARAVPRWRAAQHRVIRGLGAERWPPFQAELGRLVTLAQAASRSPRRPRRHAPR